MSTRQKLIAVHTIIFSFLLLTACSTAAPKPDNTVLGFFQTINGGNLEGAKAYLSNPRERMLTPADDREKLVMNMVFSRASCKIISTEVNYDTAKVRAKITALNMEKMINDAKAELLPKIMEAMKSPKDGEEKAKELAWGYLNSKYNDANMPMATTEVDIKLKLTEDMKKWLIEDNYSFKNAITGNAFKALGM